MNQIKYWFRKKFRFPVFMGLHVLGCPEDHLAISEKDLPLCICNKNVWQVQLKSYSTEFYKTLYLALSCHKLKSINF